MKFTIKTSILILFLSTVMGLLLRNSNKNEYELLKPEVIRTNDDRTSWGIIMDVKKQVFKNIEKHWQNKHTNERK